MAGPGDTKTGDPGWNEKDVFLGALGKPAAERDAFLDAHCPDAESKARIQTLLRHHAQASDKFVTIDLDAAGTAPTLPSQIEEFKILHRLGEGGMGVVYLAEDTILGRRVALKVLARHLTGSEQALARFREEARSAASLTHPAIVPVFKFGRDGDDYYLVSEYVDGRTLADLIAERKKGLSKENTDDIRQWHRQAAEIIATIADALDTAHRAQIVHRDVKPSNILMDRTRGPRLTDFGIAKHLVEEDRTRQTGLIGSCHYMSPEQADIANTRIDQRSDLFSLGVVLYEMLALRLPFEGATLGQVLIAVIECNPNRLSSLNTGVPKDLETITQKSLEKRPSDRYQTAAHVAADLRCWLAGDPILASPPSIKRMVFRWISKHRRRSTIGVVLILVSALALLSWKLKTSTDATKAWFQIESEVPAKIFCRAISPTTLEPEASEKLLGVTPIVRCSLAPGQYRITLVTADGSLTEFNLIAIATGINNLRVLRGRGIANYARLPSMDQRDSSTLEGALVSASAASQNMQFIPEGNYMFGSDTTSDKRFHSHTVHISSFFLDRYAVTNREYRVFANATGHASPAHWTEYGFDETLAERPVVRISLEDAEAYARWRGKRLPTICEWQAATRGTRGALYPWGDQLEEGSATPGPPIADATDDLSRLDFKLYARYQKCTTNVDVVNNLLGTPHFLQIFGNVRELTGSILIDKRDVISAGRAWSDPVNSTTLGDVWMYPMEAISFKHGFRCAKSAQLPVEQQ